MITVSFLYRCLIGFILNCVYLSQWFHRLIAQLIHRNHYAIRVNIDFKRQDNFWLSKNQIAEKIQFNKPTETVALIINERIPDVDLLQFIVNAIIFFQQLKVQHLVIYDYRGYIKTRRVEILDHLNQYEKKIESLNRSPEIHFESLSESSEVLTCVAKQICNEVCQGQLRSDSVNVNIVDRHYTKIAGFPEINLGLIIGPVRSALGFHPWLTRLTEFIMIENYRQLSSCDAFINVVQRYNRIEQRQGR